ncbi:stage II sporulation protein M [Lagierella sp.]|uniref:stage II sporulation protein M n=1 Tax=Lagierella sp. TaxID=2849657 RepID=UPI00260C7F67|nr:stage II sporulation protein M [Lagierella sp.]
MTLKEFYNTHLKKHFKIGFLVMLITFLISAVFFIFNQKLTQTILDEFMKSVGDQILVDGKISAIGLIINNVTACVVMVLLGIIPYLFLPYLSLIINGGIIGAAFAMIISNMGNKGILTFLASILPHGIFEIPAIVLSFALGVSLCIFLMDKIRKKPTTPNGVYFSNLIKTFVFVCIPLLLVAGVVEAYVTPMVMQAFM